jgi:hypothetical protein
MPIEENKKEYSEISDSIFHHQLIFQSLLLDGPEECEQQSDICLITKINCLQLCSFLHKRKIFC